MQAHLSARQCLIAGGGDSADRSASDGGGMPAAAPVMAQPLFVQNAAAVEVRAGGRTLRLKGLGPTTLFLSDRPVRIAGHYRT